MLMLYVEGVAAIKLSDPSEIPSPQGNESWHVIDADGRTIASYMIH